MGVYQSLQGNLGLSRAIHFFVSNGYCVSIPLNDTQGYDLVVEKDGILQRVQVKTSRGLTDHGSYAIQLRNTGGEDKTRKVPFDNKKQDLLFVYTADENIYLIPSLEISATNSIKVRPDGGPYAKYLVHDKTMNDF